MMVGFENLQGVTLRITTIYNNLYPYDVMIQNDCKEIPKNASSSTDEDECQEYTFTGGYTADLFLHLQYLLGFNYKYVPSVDGYNFSLASVKSIDLFMGSYSLYYERALMVDPTFVTGSSKIIGLINHQFENSVQDMFILPFSLQLWLGLLGYIITCCFSLSLMAWIQKTSAYDTFFHILGMLFQKGWNLMNVTLSFRIALLCISASLIIIMGCYTGNMFSVKAVHRFLLNSIEAVIKSPHYKILYELGDVKSSISLMLLGLKHIPIVHQLLDRISSSSSKYKYTTFEAAIVEVEKSPTVYIIDEETGISVIGSTIGKFPCSWSAFSVLNLKYPWSMFMKKGSTFKPILNYGLLRLEESGITTRLRRKWLPQATNCKGNSIPFNPIGIHQIYSAFGILLVALIISSMTLLYEFRQRIQKSYDYNKYDDS